MKIFEKYNFETKDNIISKEAFGLLDFCKKEALIPEKLEQLITAADADLTREIPNLTLSMYRAYNVNGSTSAYGAPYRMRMAMALRLALAELHTGDGKYFDKMLDVVWSMLDEPTWMLPEHTVHMPEEATKKMPVPASAGEKYAHGIELGSAYRSATIALIYHYFHDKFDEISPFINERILHTLKKRSIEPFLNYYFWWEGMGGNRVNNWCPWIVSNILFTTALVEDDMTVREAVAERSMTFLDNFINCYPEDGGCDEGPTYWNAAAACLFDSLELLEYLSGGKISIYSEPLIKAMGEYEPRMNITGVYFVNFADSRSKASQDGNMLRRYGEKCGSKILESFGDSMLGFEQLTFDTALPYRTLRCLTSPVRDVSNSKLVAATDTYFPDLKVMVLRDSENPEEGTFFAMKGGNNNESHNHNDIGQFILYRNGKPVLIDAGVGEYTKQTFSPDRYKIWSMQSLYHNLPSFDGIGQHNGARYTSKNEVYNKDGRSLSLELADAYEDECGIISYKRTGALRDGVVTISESVELKEEKLIDFMMLTHREPSITSDTAVALTEGVTIEFDPSLTAEIEPFDPVGLNAPQAWGTDTLYRLHFRIKTDKCNVTFTIR